MSAAEWIAKRRELLAAATEGPWGTFAAYDSLGVASEGDDEMLFIETYGVTYAAHAPDAALIADARTSLPRTLAALEAVLEIETAHVGPDQQPYDRDHSEGWNDALSAVRHAVNDALRADA